MGSGMNDSIPETAARIATIGGIAAAIVTLSLASAGCGDKKKDDGQQQSAPEASDTASAEPAEPAPAPPPPPKIATADEARAAVLGCWESFAGGAAEALLECYRDDAFFEVVDLVPSMEAQAGPAILASLQQAFPTLTQTPQLVLVSHNSVAAVVLLEGQHAGSLWGLPASKKKVSMLVAQVAQVDAHGKLMRDSLYFDQETLLSQIGARQDRTAPRSEKPLGEMINVEAKASPEGKKIFAAFNKQYMAAGQKGDVATMAAAYAPGAVLRYVPEAKPIEGQKAIASWLQQQAVDGLKLSMRRQWSAGDWIVAETLVDGTLGDKVYQMKRLELVRYQDGAIAEHWIFANELDKAVDLGQFDPARLK